jgi:hypothetical protein
MSHAGNQGGSPVCGGRTHDIQPHMVVPAVHWPRGKVYYYDPDARAVFGLDKHAPPVSPLTGRTGCRDIFTEMAERLNRSLISSQLPPHRRHFRLPVHRRRRADGT